ncbi:hypothetical protein BST61_g705 [Cercospora zeina]
MEHDAASEWALRTAQSRNFVQTAYGHRPDSEFGCLRVNGARVPRNAKRLRLTSRGGDVRGWVLRKPLGV